MTGRGTSDRRPQEAWRRPVSVVLVAVLLLVVSALADVPATASPATSSAARSVGQVDPPVAPLVAFFGDSIGYNAEAELRAAIEPSYRFLYRAAGGADIDLWRDRMIRVARERRPDTLLIELGTADAGWDHSSRRFEREVRELLDAVSPEVSCIRWFDIRAEPSLFDFVNRHAVAFNEILWRVAAEYPNVEVVHYSYWATLAHDGNYWWPDQLHHNAAGRRQLGLLAGQAAVGCDPARTSGPFWDVPDDHPTAAAVAWMAATGISGGFANGTYRGVVGSLRPTVTRGQAATFLWRLAGSPDGVAAHPWTDVPSRLAIPVDWSTATGVMPGFEDGTWRSKAPVTRAQLVSALWHLAGDPTGAAPRAWTDVPPGLTDAFDWAVGAGLLSGLPDGSARPDATINRAKIATMLYAYHLSTTAPPTPSTTVPSTTVPSTTVPTPPIPTTTPATATTLPPPTTAPPTTALPEAS